MLSTHQDRIVLFNPKPSKIYQDKNLPLALLSISAKILNEFQIEIIDAGITPNFKKKMLESIGSDVICVGITMMTGHQIKEGLAIAKLVKQVNSKIKIVVGGYHASILPKETCQHPLIDVVVRGQGEQTFLELVRALKNNQSLRSIKGITYKNQKKVFHNHEREIMDINTFPTLPLELINIENYIRETVFGKRTLTYISSQGCPFNCSFCAEPQVYKRFWSGRNPKIFVDEIQKIQKKYHLDALILYDSNFFVDQKRVTEICQRIINKKIKINFCLVNGRASQLAAFSTEIWFLLKKAGFKEIVIGAESGCQNTLDLIHKKIKIQDILQVKKLASQCNISLFCNFMCGFPFPFKLQSSIRNDLKSSLKIIKQVHAIDDNNTFGIWIYTPYPGNELFKQSLNLGFKVPTKLEEWGKFNFRDINVPWQESKIKNLCDFLNEHIFLYINYYYNPTWRRNFLIEDGFKEYFHLLLRKIALFRFKHDLFSFPIEFKFKKIIKLLQI